ncbi:hypothetical protein DFH06DRAFT_1144555 [Mycena polygramma]|nr:hypothetical protein DFH06DRAFT_1144555 [Mycena polygramma]
MSSPPRISLKTPPPSPGPFRITLASVGDEEAPPIVSPMKRTRTVNQNPAASGHIGVRARKKRKSHGNIAAAKPGDHIALSLEPEQEDNPRGASPDGDSEIPFQEPESLDKVDQQGYSDYVDSVLEDGTAFFQIAPHMFVVNGWDPKAKRSKPTWYHIQRSKIGSESVCVCTCPATNADDTNQDVILFSRQIELNELEFMNHFSCPSPHKRGLAGRVVVTYEGSDDGNGRWNCEKDAMPCSHVAASKTKLQQLVHVDPNAEDIQQGQQELYDHTGEKSFMVTLCHS